MEEKKLATAARKAEIVTKKQERQACLISLAEAKVTKAVAKADELHAKLAKAASADVAPTSSGRVQAAAALASAASNKKSKGTAGAPSHSAVPALAPQLSPQWKLNMVNKRVSVQSPRQFSLHSNLSSSDCSTDRSSNGRVIKGGDNTTNNKVDSSFDFPLINHGRQSKARRGPRSGSLVLRNRTGLTPGGSSSTASTRLKKQSSSSDSSSTNDNLNSIGDLMKTDSSDSDGNEANSLLLDLFLTPVCLTTLFEGDGTHYHQELIESNIIDGIWLGNHDITLLTHFSDCHFDGDWNRYLYFGQWAEEQRLAAPSASIQLNDWLSLKSDGADSYGLSSSLSIERMASSAEDTACSPLVHKLCNETAHDSVDSLPSITGRRSGTSSAETLSVQLDICTMFPAMRACNPDKIAAAKFMDEEWVLQESAEETRVARMQARKKRFVNAAKLTVAKEREFVGPHMSLRW